jgi:hypothetical protein
VQRRDGLRHTTLSRLFGLRALDREDEPLLVAEDSPSNFFFAFGSRFSALAKSAGTSTSRGFVSSSISTSIWSPAATPAFARTSALTPSMNRPPIVATVLRYV